MDQELINAIETARKECKDPYAQSYLRAMPTAESAYGDEGIGMQLLYCLDNMSGWRGENARATKLVFKKYAKMLTKRS